MYTHPCLHTHAMRVMQEPHISFKQVAEGKNDVEEGTGGTKTKRNTK